MILQVFLALILVALAQALIYRLLALRGLTYSCTLSHYRIYEGDSNELVEVIENKKLLPLLWLKAETRFNDTILFTKNDNTCVSSGGFHRSVLSLPAMRRVRRTYSLVCTKRGYYNLGSATVTTGDLFGLVNMTLSYTPETGLHVYPIPIRKPELCLPSRSFQGDVVVRRFFLPDPFMPAGVRDYTADDPMNIINWKASVKSGKLVVHKCDFTADSNLMVFFNVDYSATTWDNTSKIKNSTMEHALRILAGILDMSIQSGQRTALWTNATSLRDKQEVYVPAASGRTHREELFAALAEMQFVRSRNFFMLLQEASKVVRDTDILLMTRYLTTEIQIEIEALRHAGNKVEVFTIPNIKNENSRVTGLAESRISGGGRHGA